MLEADDVPSLEEGVGKVEAEGIQMKTITEQG